MLEPEGVKLLIAIVLLKEYELKEIIRNLFHYHHSILQLMSCLSLGQVRREKISERMKFLQDLVPGCNKVLTPC